MSQPSLHFKSIVIIYNPNSTGGAGEAAENLEQQLRERLPSTRLKVLKTKRAKHAIELARSAVLEHDKPLLISVSGDGGYHEVINGAMLAGKPFIGAIYPAGNANDHRRTTKRHDLVEAIIQGKVTTIDLLHAQITSGKSSQGSYAHSYIGLGISPVVATELNRHTLNRLKEAMLVWRTFRQYQPFKIKLENGRTKEFNSLVFANINQMAKVLTLSDDGKPTDGKFEVITWPATSKLQLALLAIKAAVSSLGKQPQVSTYSFQTVVDMLMQMDGEVVELMAGSRVEITAAAGALKTIR